MEHGFSTPEKVSSRNYNVFGGGNPVIGPSEASEKGLAASSTVLKGPFPSPVSASRLPVFGSPFPKKDSVAFLEPVRCAQPQLPSDAVGESKGDFETPPRVVMQRKRKLDGDTLNTPTKIRTTTTTPGAPKKKLRPSESLFAKASSTDVKAKCPILALWLCFEMKQFVLFQAAPKKSGMSMRGLHLMSVHPCMGSQVHIMN